jgi:hypothetical protein
MRMSRAVGGSVIVGRSFAGCRAIFPKLCCDRDRFAVKFELSAIVAVRVLDL